MPNCQSCGKEIGEDGLCVACLNAQNRQQAMPPSSSGKGALIAVIGLVVIMIVIIAVTLVFFGGGGNSSPAGVVESYVNKITAGDIEGALHCTDAHFMIDSDFNDHVSGTGDSRESFNIISLETRYQEDMTSNEIEDAEDKIEGMEEEYGIKIDEFCMVDYTMTSYDGDYSSDLLCVKVGNSWYMVIYGYYY